MEKWVYVKGFYSEWRWTPTNLDKDSEISFKWDEELDSKLPKMTWYVPDDICFYYHQTTIKA